MRNFLSILSILLFILPIHAAGYLWHNLPVGGGGYITGIVAHPTAKDVIYLRTDVGGIYKKDSVSTPYGKQCHWRQLMNWIPAEDYDLWGCDGIALNPMNPNEIYAYLGSYRDSKSYGLYKSADQGTKWVKLLNVKATANEDSRWVGEPIAVVPQGKGKTVYFATRFDGLQKTVDGGLHWKKIFDPNITHSADAMRSIAINPLSVQEIYVAASRHLFHSTDGGTSFSEKILASKPIRYRAVKFTCDGSLIVSTDKGIFKIAKNSSVTDISPTHDSIDWNAIAVDPHNPNHIVVSELKHYFNCRIFRTIDQGASWSELTAPQHPFIQKNNVPWYNPIQFASAVSSLVIDPFCSNRLWFGDWYQPWVCNDLSANKLKFESQPWGVEELVVFDIAAPTNNIILYNGCADNGGLSHVSLSQYPTCRFPSQETTGLDFCEKNANFVVRAASSNWGKNNFTIDISKDAGLSWTTILRPASTGKVAYSATDTDNILYAPTGKDQALLYTSDGGKTWNRPIGVPEATFNASFWENWDKPIAADRKNGSIFYAITGGWLYSSINKGATFQVQNTAELPTPVSLPGYYLSPSPYQQGELWLSVGGSGLYHTIDAGVSFTKIQEISDAKNVTVGPPLMQGKPPIIYSYAKVNDNWGVYRSLDNGDNWERINDDNTQLSNFPRQIAADRKTPGRIYLATGGTGIYYGEISK